MHGMKRWWRWNRMAQGLLMGSALLLSALPARAAAANAEAPLQHMVHAASRDILALGALLFLAALAKRACESRFLKQPSVLGFFVTGVLLANLDWLAERTEFIRPLADGAAWLFPSHGGFSFSPGIWMLGALGVVILLCFTGLEVNFDEARKVGVSSAAVAIGGVVLPFVLAVATLALLPRGLWFHADWLAAGLHWKDAAPLAVVLMFAATSVATSVGVTAAVYGELKVLDTREGLVVLMAGIWDDIIGLLVLTGVLLFASGGGGLGAILKQGAVAGVFLAAVLALRLVNRRMSDRLRKSLGSAGAVAMFVALMLLVAASAELGAGLAMIVGAAVFGLAFAGTRLGHDANGALAVTKDLLSPVFFIVMGMLMDFYSMFASAAAIQLALVFTATAYAGKILGCGIPARWFGFSWSEAWRIGVGMNNRGEVGFIVAGIGLATGVLDSTLFGAAAFMIFATTAPTPPLLKMMFAKAQAAAAVTAAPMRRWANLPAHVAAGLMARLGSSLQSVGFRAVMDQPDLLELSNGGQVISVRRTAEAVELDPGEVPEQIIRFVVTQAKEEMSAEVDAL